MGTADQGSSAPMRSPTSSSSSRALKTTETADLDDLANMEPLATPPIPESRDAALAESIASALQKAFAPSPLEPPKPPKPPKLPAVPTLTKLKGKDNYKTWIYEIQSNAEIHDVWDAVINPDTLLSRQEQAFALSLVFRNTIPSIQTALTAFSTAPKAWQYLAKQYNKQNIAQLVKEVQDLTFLDYNSFSTIESFQHQSATTNERQRYIGLYLSTSLFLPATKRP
jgi:hypothetical protein